jgi:hypothetical protein
MATDRIKLSMKPVPGKLSLSYLCFTKTCPKYCRQNKQAYISATTSKRSFKGLKGRLHFKRDGTRAESRFHLSAKRTSPFKSAGRQVSRLLSAEVCASAVVMLDTPCSEVVWRVLATHSIRQFSLHFPSRASPCAITFQLDSTSAVGRHICYHMFIWGCPLCSVT